MEDPGNRSARKVVLRIPRDERVNVITDFIHLTWCLIRIVLLHDPRVLLTVKRLVLEVIPDRLLQALRPLQV